MMTLVHRRLELCKSKPDLSASVRSVLKLRGRRITMGRDLPGADFHRSP